MGRCMNLFQVFCLFIKSSGFLASPIVFPAIIEPSCFPMDFCLLPPEYGTQGQVRFLEDCNSLDQYEYLPMPGPGYQKLGTHALVCCPKKIHKEDFICLPTDAWCPSYEEQTSNIFINLSSEVTITMDSKRCYNTSIPDGKVLTNCVPINRCTQLLEYPNAPLTVMQPCGFDEDLDTFMICCPEELTEDPIEITQKPRFPVNNEARPCEDRHDLCSQWKNNGGCALDQDFYISETDGNGRVKSSDMFGFMEVACPESCGLCGSKGCVDEYPKCNEWSKAGMCVLNPFVMAHMCRESCGVCGFLSSFSNEDQEKDGNSYTDFVKPDFHCGQFGVLSEAEDKSEEQTTNNEDEAQSDILCGATMISDRWALTAAHCYAKENKCLTGEQRQVRVNTVRKNTENKEIIEIKSIYLHPQYNYPSLYNDIAVLELGRRVEYDYQVFGDSPSCIDQGTDVMGKLGNIQGFGLGDGKLLESNVTLLSNDLCAELINYNKSINPSIKKDISKDIPDGLNDGLLCAKGLCAPCGDDDSDNDTFKVDAGGPLTILDEQNRTTLVGIGSGGIQDEDRKGFTGWFTRVSFHTRWILCIIESTKNRKSKSAIKNVCMESVNTV